MRQRATFPHILPAKILPVATVSYRNASKWTWKILKAKCGRQGYRTRSRAGFERIAEDLADQVRVCDVFVIAAESARDALRRVFGSADVVELVRREGGVGTCSVAGLQGGQIRFTRVRARSLALLLARRAARDAIGDV